MPMVDKKVMDPFFNPHALGIMCQLNLWYACCMVI